MSKHLTLPGLEIHPELLPGKKPDFDETHCRVKVFIPAPTDIVKAKAKLQLLTRQPVYLRAQIQTIVSAAPHLEEGHQLMLEEESRHKFVEVQELERAWGMICLNPGLIANFDVHQMRALAGLMNRGGTLEAWVRIRKGTTHRKPGSPTLWLNVRSKHLIMKPLEVEV